MSAIIEPSRVECPKCGQEFFGKDAMKKWAKHVCISEEEEESK
jgi:formylmethanofuran dehydrogenase subunit E